MAEQNPIGDAHRAAARAKGQKAADDLFGVAQEKRRSESAPLDPSSANAARAKSEWSQASGEEK